MKKKILSIIFVAAMYIGFALGEGSDQGTCITVQEECGPKGGFIAIICGTGKNDFEVRLEQDEQLSFWMEVHGC